MTAMQELTAAVQIINDALGTLRDLDSIEKYAERERSRLHVKRDYNSSNAFSEAENAIIASMFAAGKRRAAELGREARAEAVEKATAVIESYRAILPQLAAKAAVEIGAAARGAA